MIPVVNTVRTDNARGSLIDPRSNIDTAPDSRASVGYLSNLAEERRAEVERADRLRATVARAEHKVAVETGMEALDPMAADYDARVDELVARARADALTRAAQTTTVRSDALATELDIVGIQYGGAALLRRRQAIQQQTAVQLDQLSAAFLSRVAADPDNAPAQIAEFDRVFGDAVANLPFEAQAAARRDFARQTSVAVIGGYMDRGDFESARRAADEASPVLGPEAVRAKKQEINGAEQTARARRLVETQRAASDFRASVERTAMDVASVSTAAVEGRDIGDPLEVLGRARDAMVAHAAQFGMLEAGGVWQSRDGERVARQQEIETLGRQIDAAERQVLGVYMQYDSGGGLDSVADANIAWNREKAERLTPQSTPGDVALAMGQFVSRAGVVPGEVASFIRNAGRTGDATLLSAGAQLHDAITALNPQAALDASPLLKATSALIRHGRLTPNTAAEIAMRGQDPAVAAARTEQLAMAVSGELSALSIDDAIRGSLDAGPLPVEADEFTRRTVFGARDRGAVLETDREPGFFTPVVRFGRRAVLEVQNLFQDDRELLARDAPIPDDARRQYADTYREIFQATGDAAVAQRAAKNAVNAEFGMSKLGRAQDGGLGIMRFPPERELVATLLGADPSTGATALTGDEAATYLAEKLSGELTRLGLPQLDGNRVRLRATEQTRLQIAAGQPPSYLVEVLDPTGLVVPLANGRDIMSFTLPTAAAIVQDPVYQRIVAEAQRPGIIERTADQINRSLGLGEAPASTDRTDP